MWRMRRLCLGSTTRSHSSSGEKFETRNLIKTADLSRALLSPGWQKEFHVGVRATQSRKLVAFISAIPVDLRVRKTTFKASEVNFLCIHKKLRSKRLAPVLIKEITRRSHLQGIWQGLYTAGIVLPKPISTCRYYHRSINWQKLFEVGFSPLPKNSKPQYQVRKYALPDNTATKGLRPMEAKDVDAVVELLNKFLGKFDLAPNFTRAEVDHWLLHKLEVYKQQVIWSYVVEVCLPLPFFPSRSRTNCFPGPINQPTNRLLLLLLPRIQRNQQLAALQRPRGLLLLLRLHSRHPTHRLPQRLQSSSQRTHERRPDPR